MGKNNMTKLQELKSGQYVPLPAEKQTKEEFIEEELKPNGIKLSDLMLVGDDGMKIAERIMKDNKSKEHVVKFYESIGATMPTEGGDHDENEGEKVNASDTSQNVDEVILKSSSPDDNEDDKDDKDPKKKKKKGGSNNKDEPPVEDDESNMNASDPKTGKKEPGEGEDDENDKDEGDGKKNGMNASDQNPLAVESENIESEVNLDEEEGDKEPPVKEEKSGGPMLIWNIKSQVPFQTKLKTEEFLGKHTKLSLQDIMGDIQMVGGNDMTKHRVFV